MRVITNYYFRQFMQHHNLIKITYYWGGGGGGDFNCSRINWEDISTTNLNTESLSFKLIETIRDCFLGQVIMESTRARGTTNPSLLDLVVCYDAMLITNLEYHSPLGKSDHSVIYLVIQWSV